MKLETGDIFIDPKSEDELASWLLTTSREHDDTL